MLKVYPAATDAEALESAAALASDLFIGYATWKWIEVHARTGQLAGLSLLVRPQDSGCAGREGQRRRGDVARHRRAARRRDRIRLRHARLDRNVTWEPSDRAAVGRDDDLLGQLRARPAIRTATGLPKWPRYDAGGGRVLHLDETIKAAPDVLRPRYEALDAFVEKAGQAKRLVYDQVRLKADTTQCLP